MDNPADMNFKVHRQRDNNAREAKSRSRGVIRLKTRSVRESWFMDDKAHRALGGMNGQEWTRMDIAHSVHLGKSLWMSDKLAFVR